MWYLHSVQQRESGKPLKPRPPERYGMLDVVGLDCAKKNIAQAMNE